ncbi:MAG: hypothetical protein ACNA7U_02790 [Candidatus Izemoplasmataceae bacterium]|jgi:fluoroquinolone transport system permease protein
MNNFLLLFKGEMLRLVKYKILQISFAVTVLWVLVIYLIGKENAATFIPVFIFTDAALMTVLLVGASLFYERQENTLKTLMITPSGYHAILSSKIVSAIYLALQSTVLIALFSYFVFGVEIKLLLLFIFIALIAFVHTAIGYTFTIYSRDFNGLIASVGGYMIVFAIPSIFSAFGIIPDSWDFILLISPTHVSLKLIEYTFNGDVALWVIIGGIIYLLGLTVVLLKYIVAPKYAEMAVRE